MNLESQVVSLELAKKLKELGVKKEDCLFYWISRYDNWSLVFNESFEDALDKYIFMNTTDAVLPAFTVAELGEMLPRIIHPRGESFLLYIFKDVDNNWHLKYENHLLKKFNQQYDDNEANARAKMLIHLIENKVWNPDK